MHAGAPPDGARRRAAALAGFEGEATVALGFFGDDDEGVRALALSALVRLNQADAEVVARALADPAAVVRRRACELAGRLQGADYVSLLDDEDASVVEAACFAVGETADARALPALARIAADHDDALCRESAVAALGAIGDQAGLPAILAALHDRPPVRRRAVIALAPFDGPEVEAALRSALADRDWQVRQAAEDLLRD